MRASNASKSAVLLALVIVSFSFAHTVHCSIITVTKGKVLRSEGPQALPLPGLAQRLRERYEYERADLAGRIKLPSRLEGTAYHIRSVLPNATAVSSSAMKEQYVDSDVRHLISNFSQTEDPYGMKQYRYVADQIHAMYNGTASCSFYLGCLNEGQCNKETGVCTCKSGYSGDLCQTVTAPTSVNLSCSSVESRLKVGQTLAYAQLSEAEAGEGVNREVKSVLETFNTTAGVPTLGDLPTNTSFVVRLGSRESAIQSEEIITATTPYTHLHPFLGTSSWMPLRGSDGEKTAFELHLTRFISDITMGDVECISFYSPLSSQGTLDSLKWYLNYYGGVDDNKTNDASWYGRRIDIYVDTSHTFDAQETLTGFDAKHGVSNPEFLVWTKFSTCAEASDSRVVKLYARDRAYTGQKHNLHDMVGAETYDLDGQEVKDYRDRSIMGMRWNVGVGRDSATAPHSLGQIDGLTLTLKGGRELVFDLESDVVAPSQSRVAMEVEGSFVHAYQPNLEGGTDVTFNATVEVEGEEKGGSTNASAYGNVEEAKTLYIDDAHNGVSVSSLTSVLRWADRRHSKESRRGREYVSSLQPAFTYDNYVEYESGVQSGYAVDDLDHDVMDDVILRIPAGECVPISFHRQLRHGKGLISYNDGGAGLVVAMNYFDDGGDAANASIRDPCMEAQSPTNLTSGFFYSSRFQPNYTMLAISISNPTGAAIDVVLHATFSRLTTVEEPYSDAAVVSTFGGNLELLNFTYGWTRHLLSARLLNYPPDDYLKRRFLAISPSFTIPDDVKDVFQLCYSGVYAGGVYGNSVGRGGVVLNSSSSAVPNKVVGDGFSLLPLSVSTLASHKERVLLPFNTWAMDNVQQYWASFTLSENARSFFNVGAVNFTNEGTAYRLSTHIPTLSTLIENGYQVETTTSWVIVTSSDVINVCDQANCIVRLQSVELMAISSMLGSDDGELVAIVKMRVTPPGRDDVEFASASNTYDPVHYSAAYFATSAEGEKSYTGPARIEPCFNHTFPQMCYFIYSEHRNDGSSPDDFTSIDVAINVEKLSVGEVTAKAGQDFSFLTQWGKERPRMCAYPGYQHFPGESPLLEARGVMNITQSSLPYKSSTDIDTLLISTGDRFRASATFLPTRIHIEVNTTP
uniref:EGF-like domain-containing protein n=1 Tax=Palpitomonas bilix TaxID=652834 RepID=A0A7S3G8S0_9EUKA|mmetsp:Transcript_28926/g.74245  ORF Transcript_28926/g.74245 Transcript_28926/m.74245 type:complete len:1139 (+) Transcript_28926:279-3695(+)